MMMMMVNHEWKRKPGRPRHARRRQVIADYYLSVGDIVQSYTYYYTIASEACMDSSQWPLGMEYCNVYLPTKRKNKDNKIRRRLISFHIRQVWWRFFSY